MSQIYDTRSTYDLSLCSIKHKIHFVHQTRNVVFTNKYEVFKEEYTDKKGYLNNELESLGIEAKRKNEELINNKEELEQLADNIKTSNVPRL